MRHRFIVILISYVFALLPLKTNAATISTHHPIRKVLLVVAMDTEAQPIIHELQLHKITHSFSGLPMQGYSGKQGKVQVLLMMNGQDPINKVQNIGTEAATLSTYLGIEYFHPDLIISIGTAGGVKENGARLKDIYVSQKIYFVDRRIPMEGYRDYGLGQYESTSLPILNNNHQLKLGVICSEGSFDEEKIDHHMFLKEHCAAIEMEAAGVAWVSMLTKTPMFAMKGITNFVSGNQIHTEFENNLPSVTSELAIQLKRLIAQL